MRHAALKAQLESLVDRTGRVEDMLEALSEIYRERAGHPEYATRRAAMHQAAHVLHEAAEATARAFAPRQNPENRLAYLFIGNGEKELYASVSDALEAAPYTLKRSQLVFVDLDDEEGAVDIYDSQRAARSRDGVPIARIRKLHPRWKQSED